MSGNHDQLTPKTRTAVVPRCPRCGNEPTSMDYGITPMVPGGTLHAIHWRCGCGRTWSEAVERDALKARLDDIQTAYDAWIGGSIPVPRRHPSKEGSAT